MRASVSTVNAPQRECSHFRCACLPGACRWEMARSSMTYVQRTPDRTATGLCGAGYPVKTGLTSSVLLMVLLLVHGRVYHPQPQSSLVSHASEVPKDQDAGLFHLLVASLDFIPQRRGHCHRT